MKKNRLRWIVAARPQPFRRPRSGTATALGFLFTLLACGREAPEPPLGPDEEALVRAYVRLAVVQALHETAPDSTAAVLRDLGAEVDTLAVRRALDRLSKDPLRWELVYGAIATQLEDLEETPALWWSVAHGDSVHVPPKPRPPEPAPSGRIPAPGR